MKTCWCCDVIAWIETHDVNTVWSQLVLWLYGRGGMKVKKLETFSTLKFFKFLNSSHVARIYVLSNIFPETYILIRCYWRVTGGKKCVLMMGCDMNFQYPLHDLRKSVRCLNMIKVEVAWIWQRVWVSHISTPYNKTTVKYIWNHYTAAKHPINCPTFPSCDTHTYNPHRIPEYPLWDEINSCLDW